MCASFLQQTLSLELHMGKLEISEVHRGVEFPWCIHIAISHLYLESPLTRMRQKMEEINRAKPYKITRSVNSYLGIMHHANTYNMKRRILMNPSIMKHGTFEQGMQKTIITDCKVLRTPGSFCCVFQFGAVFVC